MIKLKEARTGVMVKLKDVTMGGEVLEQLNKYYSYISYSQEYPVLEQSRYVFYNPELGSIFLLTRELYTCIKGYVLDQE